MKLHSSKYSNLRHGLFYRLPVVVYAGLIFLLSSLPHLPEEIPPFVDYDKLAHFIEYFLLGILIRRWLVNERNDLVRRHALFMTTLIGMCYGLSDEWHQSFVPGRVASIWDGVFDAAGIAASVLTYRLTTKRDSSLVSNVRLGTCM